MALRLITLDNLIDNHPKNGSIKTGRAFCFVFASLFGKCLNKLLVFFSFFFFNSLRAELSPKAPTRGEEPRLALALKSRAPSRGAGPSPEA